MAAFDGPKDLQPHELSCNCGHCIGLRVSEPFRKELANLRAELSSAKEENVKLKQRIDVAYGAVSDVLTDPDKDINLTRLHDWLGGEDVPAESIVCDSEESEVAKLKEELAALAQGAKVRIPKETMEQEFQSHYRRGFDAGKKSAEEELEKIRNFHGAAEIELLTIREELAACKVDAERYRYLRDSNDVVLECTVERRGYRSTSANAAPEKWLEREGRITSRHPLTHEPFPTMDAAIDDHIATIAARSGD